MAGLLLVASCSTGDDGHAEADDSQQLNDKLCATDISTSALRNMYPGPYSSTKMLPSKNGGINALGGAGGNAEGYCDIWITQKAGNVSSTPKVLVRVHPGESVDDLSDRYEKFYPSYRSQRLTLGAARGFTAYNGSVLAFDCREPKKKTSTDRALGVSVHVFLPDQPDGAGADRSKLAKGAAELAADTARYVSSTVLECTGAGLPEGAPAQKQADES